MLQCPEDYIRMRPKSAPDSLWDIMWHAIFQEAAAITYFHDSLRDRQQSFQSTAQISGVLQALTRLNTETRVLTGLLLFRLAKQSMATQI